MSPYDKIVEKVADTLVRSGSSFRPDQINKYREAIEKESNPQSKWILEQILEDALVADRNKSPLCDDTGIPHLFLEIGKKKTLTGEMINAILEGVKKGLQQLPGRPMAVKGDDEERLAQSAGLYEDPGSLLPAPIQLCLVDEEVIRLHIIMEGGGPAIRGRSYRVFHRHSAVTVMDQIVEWGKEAVAQLGCSPCTLAVGIGRSHYEASALMMQAQVYGRYDVQSKMEQTITDQVNEAHIGALGLHGDYSVLATFLRVGPQRASGVRIVCIRPCCCFEPRISSVEL